MNHKLHEAMNQISDKHLTEAETYQKRLFPFAWVAAAAMLTLVLLLGFAFGGSLADPAASKPLLDRSPTQATSPTSATPSVGPSSSPATSIPTVAPTTPIATSPSAPPVDLPDNLANLVAAPQYPEILPQPEYFDYPSYADYRTAYDAWYKWWKDQYDQPTGYADSLTNFFRASIAQFLQSDGNAAYSPLNVYMAMAMLAETTGGNSRQQILDLFGVNTIEELRTQADHVWNAHYADDKDATLLMANSLWLDHEFPYRQETANRLAQYYYSSVFHGDLGTDSLNKQLQTWLNDNTGGLLKDQANNVKLSPNTVFALASTIYFSASWYDEFSEESTWEDTFHSPAGDIQVPFMHQTRRDTYYRGTHFGAIQLQLSGNNRMWLILPDEGYTTEDILKSDEYLRLTLDPQSWLDRKYVEIHLSLPKFDVVQQQDLIAGMKQLGVTDVFSPTVSDFSPISDMQNLFVSQINHAARVTIDEKGCTAAAFTVIAAEGEGIPDQLVQIHFTLDRPFLFLVTSRDHLPLFAGVVKEP